MMTLDGESPEFWSRQDSPRSTFLSRAGVAALVIGTFLLVNGCSMNPADLPPDISPADQVRAAMGRLPTLSTAITDVFPITPDGSYLFGAALDNGTRLNVTAASAQMLAASVVDENRAVLWAEIRTADSLTILLPTGDRLVFGHQGEYSRVSIVLSATAPASRFVLVEGNDGEMRFDEELSSIGPELAEKPAARRDMAMHPIGTKPTLDAGQREDDCHERTATILEGIGKACDIYSFFSVTGIERKALDFICTANDRMLQWAAEQHPGSAQWIAVVQASLAAACAAADGIAVGIGAIVDPGTWFCVVISEGQTAWLIASGQPFDQWLGDMICETECPEGRARNPETNACDCISPQIEDAAGKCFCPNGGIFDPEQETCDCTGGQVINPDTGQCDCPPGVYWDGANCVCPEGTILDPTADWDTPACLTCVEGAERVCELRDAVVPIIETLYEIAAAIGECEATPGCDTGPLVEDYEQWFGEYSRLSSAMMSIYITAQWAVLCPNLPEFEACLLDVENQIRSVSPGNVPAWGAGGVAPQGTSE